MADISPNNLKRSMKMLWFLDDEINIISNFLAEKQMTAYEASKNTWVSHINSNFIITKFIRQWILHNVINNEDEKLYKICSKEEFINWIEEKKKENIKIYDNAKFDIEMFFNNIDELSWKPNISYYEWKEWIIEIYKDMIETWEDIYWWTDIEKIYDIIWDYMYTYIESRKRKWIDSYAIMTQNEKNIEFEKRWRDWERRFVKYNEWLPVDWEIRIYWEKVAIIRFKDKEPVWIVISWKMINNIFKAIFQNTWDSTI